jgi:hypothetical protein
VQSGINMAMYSAEWVTVRKIPRGMSGAQKSRAAGPQWIQTEKQDAWRAAKQVVQNYARKASNRMAISLGSTDIFGGNALKAKRQFNYQLQEMQNLTRKEQTCTGSPHSSL